MKRSRENTDSIRRIIFNRLLKLDRPLTKFAETSMKLTVRGLMFPVARIIYGGCTRITDNPNFRWIPATSSVNTLVHCGDQHAKVQSDCSQLQQSIFDPYFAKDSSFNRGNYDSVSRSGKFLWKFISSLMFSLFPFSDTCFSRFFTGIVLRNSKSEVKEDEAEEGFN